MIKKSLKLEKEVMVNLPQSGVLVFDEGLCTGCGTCELMCSLYHEGVAGSQFSRVNVVEYHFIDRIELYTCKQCPYPSCYFACPLRDMALCLDEATGARYVNEEECTGCGECIDACPLDPPRLKLNTQKDVVFKCDICKDRSDGPVCVEYCNHEALKFIPKEETKKHG